MKIQEAIKELERGTQQSRSTKNQRLRVAIRLGVEALKRIQRVRTDGDLVGPGGLPGETSD